MGIPELIYCFYCTETPGLHVQVLDIGLGLGTSQHAVLDLATFFLPNPPPPPQKKKKERYVKASRGGRGLAPNNGVRVGLVLEAGRFVSNPKFMDQVFEYSTLTQAADAVSCRHECPVCRLLEPKIRGSDVRVLDLGPVSRHYKRVSLCLSSVAY